MARVTIKKKFRGKMTKYNLESISEKLIDDIANLFETLEIENFTDYHNRIMFPCPLHNGESQTNSSVMKRGIGNWRCFSEQCHEQYGSSAGASILQFVQAILSLRKNKDVSFYEALKWAANFVGESAEEDTATPEDTVRIQFIQLCKYINRHKANNTPVFTPRTMVRKFLQIPATYYLELGYSEQILNKFDIGYCYNTQKSFFDRIVTPFYDDNGEYMIGCTGRSKYKDRCGICNLYHAPDIRCPITKEEKLRAVKWKHSGGFAADAYLYNYWNAKKYILDTYTVILVEGPGDVWRMEEAGIYNSLALLGARLSPNQQIILEESGAVNILIATDNDDAGNKAANNIIANCNRLFNIQRVEYPGKDPGGLTIEQTKQIFIPILERI